MRYILFLTLVLAFIAPPVFSQTEAQSVEEILRFESQNSKRTIDVTESDFVKVRYPVNGGRMVKGRVTEIEDDGFEVKNRRTGAVYYVDLKREKSFLHRSNSGIFVAALVLSIIGYIGIGIFTFLILIFAILAALGGGTAALTGAIVGFFLCLFMMFLGVGFLFGSSRRVRIKDWTWKRIRKVFVPNRP